MLEKELKILKKGGIGVFPTDTAYGLGCKFNSKKGIKRILKWKRRKDEKFVLVASSLYQVKKYFKITAAQERLIKKYYYKPVSIVLNDKFSVRVPKNKLVRSLARRVGAPLIASSLNKAGQKPRYNLKGLDTKDFDFVIDGGKLKKKKPSKILKVEDGKIIIIRK